MLYDHIDINKDYIHELKIDNIDEIRTSIKDGGGLDLMVIGLGDDGHFCGNMPYKTDFLSDIYTYNLQENKDMPWYETYLSLVKEESELPDKVVTMGAPMLMKTKHLVLIVNGKEKSDIFKRFMDSDITKEIPATVLKLHPNLTVIVDKDVVAE
jgi:6-phosphogluconolactonase/glucosamine-6-phosphate isomerase/deaminase